jgi:peptidoglycan hydrolase FlgJ
MDFMSAPSATDVYSLRSMQTPASPSRATGQSEAELKEVAIEFESMFVKQMLKAARNTLNPEDNMIYGGQAEQIFTDMLDDEYAMTMSRVENMGIAKMLYEQLTGKPWE